MHNIRVKENILICTDIKGLFHRSGVKQSCVKRQAFPEDKWSRAVLWAGVEPSGTVNTLFAVR